MVEIFDLAMRAIVDTFEIYTINSLKKKFETNLIMSKALFGVTRRKKIPLLLLKEVLGHVNHFFNEISSFKHELLF